MRPPPPRISYSTTGAASPRIRFKAANWKKISSAAFEEEVIIDAEGGPLMLRRDGSTTFAYLTYVEAGYSGGSAHGFQKGWRYMTSTEQKVLVHMVAKRNRSTKELAGY
ncbi:GRIN2A [Symbiodinium pilosum]|uniref:GRIN2A protein n=1 Tax=Symbiodinium pilosum TaxID=2952 RepID=A0A812PHX7_SYMPI|nr:GRIN2A [Symbiodinium pilosum]